MSAVRHVVRHARTLPLVALAGALTLGVANPASAETGPVPTTDVASTSALTAAALPSAQAYAWPRATRATVGASVGITGRAVVAGKPVGGIVVSFIVKAAGAPHWSVISRARTTANGNALGAVRLTRTTQVGLQYALPGHPTITVRSSPSAMITAVAPSARARVLAKARALQGRPYRYGAVGPRAFDCSGYTAYVFRHSVGRALPHSSAAQYRLSHKIAKSSLRPGDLVFFRSGGRISHVAIYAGHGMIWHAPRPGRSVQLARIYSSSWSAGRILA